MKLRPGQIFGTLLPRTEIPKHSEAVKGWANRGMSAKVDPVYVQRLADELQEARPGRVPLDDEHVLLARIIYALLLSPATTRYCQLGRQRRERSGFDIFHEIGRDRRGAAEMKKILAAGGTHYNGKKIWGKGSNAYIMRWSRKEVEALVEEVTALTYNLWELEELLGLPEHHYKDDESSIF